MKPWRLFCMHPGCNWRRVLIGPDDGAPNSSVWKRLVAHTTKEHPVTSVSAARKRNPPKGRRGTRANLIASGVLTPQHKSSPEVTPEVESNKGAGE
jgi:hypothetical protein